MQASSPPKTQCWLIEVEYFSCSEMFLRICFVVSGNPRHDWTLKVLDRLIMTLDFWYFIAEKWKVAEVYSLTSHNNVYLLVIAAAVLSIIPLKFLHFWWESAVIDPNQLQLLSRQDLIWLYPWLLQWKCIIIFISSNLLTWGGPGLCSSIFMLFDIFLSILIASHKRKNVQCVAKRSLFILQCRYGNVCKCNNGWKVNCLPFCSAFTLL